MPTGLRLRVATTVPAARLSADTRLAAHVGNGFSFSAERLVKNDDALCTIHLRACRRAMPISDGGAGLSRAAKPASIRQAVAQLTADLLTATLEFSDNRQELP